MRQVYAQVDLQTTLFGNNSVGSYAASPTDYLGRILPNIFTFAGIILILYAAFAGISIITAGSDSSKAEKGKEALTNAIIGLIIIISSYWIIQIIEVITGLKIVS